MLSFTTLLLLVPAIYAQSSPAIQVVTVGQDEQLQYSPDTITAAVGSQVEFQFFGPTHSVIQASFDKPCAPFDNGVGFFAEMMTTGTGPNPMSFTITINDTNPIWFFCGFPTHCQAGMVGVINPSASDMTETLDLFRAAAEMTSSSSAPAQQQGGIIGPFKAPTSGTGSTSSASAAGSSTSTTAASSTPASTATNTPMSPPGSSVAASPSAAPSSTAASNSTGSASGSTAPGTTPTPPPTSDASQTSQFAMFGSIAIAAVLAALI